MIAARQRWIEDNTRQLAENFDISMGLYPGCYGPFDLSGIRGINVVIDYNDLFDATASGGAENGQPDVFAEAFVRLIDGKHRMQRSSPAAGHMRAFDAWQ